MFGSLAVSDREKWVGRERVSSAEAREGERQQFVKMAAENRWKW